MSGPQLTLGVKLRDDARFDNFHGDRNAAAAQKLARLCGEGAQAPVVILCGDTDTGKSHLLQAACHQLDRQGGSAVCVSLEELMPLGPDALTGLEQHALVGLDDLDLIAGNTEWEEAVFHLYNRLTDCGHRLFISMLDTPGALPFGLQDLVSRLQHGLVIQLGIYRDADRLTILRARAEKRGLVMVDEVAAYILRRAPRKLADLLAILDRLDENSLRAQRKLTIPFVKSVMGW
ncbi:DnaA regulatory inactivator Hda [Marinobacter sp. X15-166B]|uniref:DnaA regulatory inactivator Hda n=1 Tax=Marinobacter sp. X15-166B TaxID=1897620 RepID=UPI00085CB105|nr:DnaA regulatory inactivator Hda [Marinobacter sp. X15-166B]OEY67794.1 DnaA regulatory inactivator Hda [Marinobacter sp. X15-166B]